MRGVVLRGSRTCSPSAPSRSFTVLRSLDQNSLPQAFRAYVGLVEYIKLVYGEADAAKEAAQGGAVGLVALTSHLVGMANSVWSSLVRVLSRCAPSYLISSCGRRLTMSRRAAASSRSSRRSAGRNRSKRRSTRTRTRASQTSKLPLPTSSPSNTCASRVASARPAREQDLTSVSPRRQANNPIPGPSKGAVPASRKPKPLLALAPLVHPLLLRFKWQFEGDRGTNRIDKVSEA